jgi:predicted nucleic acid-binding protein
VAEFLLDTEAASRRMRAERRAVTSLRRSGAKSVSISSITMAELLYGARLREDNPSVMAAVSAFLTRPMPGFGSVPSASGGAQEHSTS